MRDLYRKFRLVFSHIGEFKKFAVITPILMIGEAGAECAIPFVMSLLVRIIEEGQGTIDMSIIWMYAGILIGLTILSIICGVLGGIFAAKASTGLARNLRHALYSKMQDFSFANIDHFQASSLVTRMTTDINNAVMAFSLVIRIVVRAPLMIIFSAVYRWWCYRLDIHRHHAISDVWLHHANGQSNANLQKSLQTL